MYEDKLRDIIELRPGATASLTIPTAADKKKQAKQVSPVKCTQETLRARQTRRIIEGFRVELNSLLLKEQSAIERTMETSFEVNYGKSQVHQSVQTEVQGVMSRHIELVIQYEKPFKNESEKPLSLDQGTMTDISEKVINFCAKGSQKYE